MTAHKCTNKVYKDMDVFGGFGVEELNMYEYVFQTKKVVQII